jgi:hypothetical protein
MVVVCFAYFSSDGILSSYQRTYEFSFFLSFVSFVILMIYMSMSQPYNLRFEAFAYHKIGFYFLLYDFILFIFG